MYVQRTLSEILVADIHTYLCICRTTIKMNEVLAKHGNYYQILLEGKPFPKLLNGNHSHVSYKFVIVIEAPALCSKYSIIQILYIAGLLKWFLNLECCIKIAFTRPESD